MFRDNYKELIRAIANDTTEDVEDFLEFVDTRISYMPEYIKAVYDHVLTVDSSSVLRREGIISVEEYKNRIETADLNRRSKHDAMLVAMDQLNRLCDKYGVQKICPENQDRHVRANFAVAVTIECFLEGIHKSPEIIRELYDEIYSPDERNVDLSIQELKHSTINKEKLKE